MAEVRLTGRVSNEIFIPLSAVRIELAEKSNPTARFATLSDSTGAFAIALPQDGEYILQAEHAGYFRIQNKTVFVNTPTQELHLTLTPLTKFSIARSERDFGNDRP